MASRELVIKIPNNYDLSKMQNGSIASKTILNAVANGTPLNEVLDKIRDEIKELEYLNIEDGSDGYDKYIEQYEVLQTIDKYITEGDGA